MKLLQCAIYIAFIGIAANPIGNALPRQWFLWDRFPYRSFQWEHDGSIYLKLRIREWKDKLPDMSRIDQNMYPKHVDLHKSGENLTRLVQETCVAEFCHWMLILLSAAVLWIWKGIGGKIIYLLCILGNLPFIIIQRFNRPRLIRTLHRMEIRG